MSPFSQQVQVKPLRRAKQPREFDVYCAGLEWSLVDPIIINDRNDLKSAPRWRERVKPFHHQVTNLITYCRRLPVTLLADDVGLGKTISAGLIASELISRRRLNNILIVAPKLLGPQWKEELESKFDIPAYVAVGRKLLDAQPDGEVGAVITTYHSARQYIERIPPDRYQMLILDEAHKLRNLYGVPNPPQVAIRFRRVLEKRAFKFVLMLTATPIQNRLWDLYSLVDLLTVAKGHQNPFGKEGLFARKFIADNATQARQLKLEAQQEFRAIVYGYMSRVRRGDAKLHFPSRQVFTQGVRPTPEELELIRLIAKPIQGMNRLAQISILQALTSSPDACAAQLENMARRGSFPGDVAAKFKAVVKSMPMSAKLQGVAALVDKLSRENPQNWRMVVFTQRRETQTTIQDYLEGLGHNVGIINGQTTGKNQATIAAFKASPPKIHVIVSTEAGSEGVNLQAANVLVNYDLPWNPMIVEQRVGRVQRLGSDHANVLIYSVTLSGTFEDYIVARLMQKLQMANHAIGDIESLLQASGMGDGEDDGAESFENHILKLVLESLAGRDVAAAAKAAEESIDRGKETLAEEEHNINEMLGAMDGAADKGPRTPDLPPQQHSMPPREFALAGLQSLGATLVEQSPDMFTCELDGGRETISFAEEAEADKRVTRYAPGNPAFDRLISRLTQSGMHDVADADNGAEQVAKELTQQWVSSFGGTMRSAKLVRVTRRYSGKAVLQVRATVAHDSYERLVPIECTGDQHQTVAGAAFLDPIPSVIDKPEQIGLSVDAAIRRALLDPGIAEFCRFYTERRAEEVHGAGNDPRSAKKLEDDFTPRLQTTLAGLQGKVDRILEGRVTYLIDNKAEYQSTLRVHPSEAKIVDAPPLVICAASGKPAPLDALGECTVSMKRAFRHLLVKSAASDRFGLPEHMLDCSVSGKRVLQTEVAPSDVTGNPVLRSLLKTSTLSGRKAEPDQVGECAFTGATGLLSELSRSEVSNKLCRSDQQAASEISGKKGHQSEFIACSVTGRMLLASEAERCDATGEQVAPGVLTECVVSHQRVVPAQLECSDETSKPVLRRLLKASDISGRKAEPDLVGRCAFTRTEALLSELATSEASAKPYRADQQACSEVSGRKGHVSEFNSCPISRRVLLASEAERCAVTGQGVFPGVLEECAVSHARVLPSLLEPSAVSGQKALKNYLVSSSVSGTRCLQEEAITSAQGKACTRAEAISCAWSGHVTHPDDIRTCSLTGLLMHVGYGTRGLPWRLAPLAEMLDANRKAADQAPLWPAIAQLAASDGRCTVESAQQSPDGQKLAVCVEQKRLLGLRMRYLGFVYSIAERAIIGKVATGKRGANKVWSGAA